AAPRRPRTPGAAQRRPCPRLSRLQARLVRDARPGDRHEARSGGDVRRERPRPPRRLDRAPVGQIQLNRGAHLSLAGDAQNASQTELTTGTRPTSAETPKWSDGHTPSIGSSPTSKAASTWPTPTSRG